MVDFCLAALPERVIKLRSRCAAIQDHLKKAVRVGTCTSDWWPGGLAQVHGAAVDMHDAAALLNFRGPRTGPRLAEAISYAHRCLT